MSRLRFAVLSAVIAVLLVLPGAVSAAPKCTIRGTDGPDHLRGTSGRDVICGGAGADVLLGEGGNDVLRGGAGGDTLDGGAGDDQLDGGGGSDWLEGGAGDDTLPGATRSDSVAGSTPDRPDVSDVDIAAAVDSHPISFSQTRSRAGEQNCTGEFGRGGSGSCGTDPSSTSYTSDPAFGAWSLSWEPRSAGGLDITLLSGDKRQNIYGYERDRGGPLYVEGGTVGSWGALTPVAPSDPSIAPGKSGGPLYVDVESHCCLKGEYDIDIKGYVAYARVDRTFAIGGFVEYLTDGPGSHPFNAGLVVFDTPSHPACNAVYPHAQGGCFGVFTRSSTAPFRGAGTSGLHWHELGNGRIDMQLVAPSPSDPHGSDGEMAGYTLGQGGRYVIESGNVPSWNARSAISTGVDDGGAGGQGDPLRVTVTPG